MSRGYIFVIMPPFVAWVVVPVGGWTSLLRQEEEGCRRACQAQRHHHATMKCLQNTHVLFCF